MRTATVITTSWDDGHPLDLRVAELLGRYNLRGTFYVPRSIPTGAMTPGEVRELSAGFEVGAHTLHHVDLSRADACRARGEIAGSRAWVEDVTGQPCAMFCPPRGRFARRDLRLIREAGYLGVRTVELLSLDFPRALDGLAIMPTTLQAHPHDWSAYARNGIRRAAAGNLWRSIVHARSAEWPRTARALLDLALLRGGVFHLWGHSWELQENAQWGRLADVLGELSQADGRATALTNGEVCRAFAARPPPRLLADEGASTPLGRRSPAPLRPDRHACGLDLLPPRGKLRRLSPGSDRAPPSGVIDP